MTISIKVWSILAVLCLSVCTQPTVLSYIIEVDEEERQDFLEMTVTTSAEGSSLSTAIAEAHVKAKELAKKAEEACKGLLKGKGACKQAVEIGKVSIEPTYKEHKKQKVFEKITATESVVIKFKDEAKFGDLVDELLRMEGIIVDKIEWKPDEDLAQNNFLEQSLEKNEELCSQLGKNFVRVVSVQELREEPEKPEEQKPAEEGQEQQEEEEPEEEQPEEQEQKTSYRITIECDGAKTKQKKAKASKK